MSFYYLLLFLSTINQECEKNQICCSAHILGLLALVRVTRAASTAAAQLG